MRITNYRLQIINYEYRDRLSGETMVLAAILGVGLFMCGQVFAGPLSPLPQAAGESRGMVEVEWSAGPLMPQGMQDNLVGVVDGWLVSACGFCSGVDRDWKPEKYPRGFLNKAWGLDLAREDAGWTALPDFPGAERQGMQGTCVDGRLYAWGGFSYSAPFTYADGYRLSHDAHGSAGGNWVWESLPPLPRRTSWAGSWAVGSKIYSLGGADYDRERFYTLTDRAGESARLGSRLIVFDTANPASGWVELAACPGTPRCMTATAAVGGKLYFVGGVAFSRTGESCNVVDSWRYDVALDTWERLRDLPISGSGTSPGMGLYKGRYMLLPCGYQYDYVMRPDGTIVPKYGEPSRINRTWKQHPKLEKTAYFNHFYVYDTQTDMYGTAPPLPFDDVATITVVLGDMAYMFPGETAGFVWQGEYFGHHPEFVLKGRLRIVEDGHK